MSRIDGLGRVEVSFAGAGFFTLGLSRRFAIPLLEWLDASGVTARHGDVRRKRRG